MIVLLKTKALFVLGAILTKLVFNYQTTFKQKFHGVVQSCPADPVSIVFHANVQRLNIEMPRVRINFLQNGKSFRSFSMTRPLEKFSEQLFYGIVIFRCMLCIVFFHAKKNFSKVTLLILTGYYSPVFVIPYYNKFLYHYE